MIFEPKPAPKDGIYETVFFAMLPYKLKDGRTVWLEKVWKKEAVEYFRGRRSCDPRRYDRVLEDAPWSEVVDKLTWCIHSVSSDDCPDCRH